jgi:hypothetical protein
LIRNAATTEAYCVTCMHIHTHTLYTRAHTCSLLHLLAFIKYAATTEALRETPPWQWTSTLPGFKGGWGERAAGQKKDMVA